MGRPPRKKATCKTCQGRGWSNRNKPGTYPVSVICKSCKGKGYVWYQPKERKDRR